MDVNPQYLKASFKQSGNDAATSTEIRLPISIFSGGDSRTLVEVLKVRFELFNINNMDVDNTAQWIKIGLSTLKSGMTYNATDDSVGSVYMSDVNTFAYHSWHIGPYKAVGTAATITPPILLSPVEVDTTDGQGHGILVAVPNIYGTIISSGTGTAVGCRVSILYRFNNAPLKEWVGFMQQQQAGN